MKSIEGVEVTLAAGRLTVTIDRLHRRNAVTPDQMKFIGADHDIQEGVAAFKENGRPEFRPITAAPRWDN